MLGTRVFRIFVSSTFRDLVAERDALQERVFPELRAHCAAQGYAFQAVDLRWGIRDEASAGHRTMRICLSEVARCQEVSPRPNFVVLLGDRYGWRPLPEIVDVEEFETLVALLDPEHVASAEAAYERDDNAVPPVYVLAPHREGEAPYNPVALREALAAAARRAGLADDAMAAYTLSATEQEIVKGAFETDDAAEHVFCFLRDLSGLPGELPSFGADPDLWPSAASYRDFRADGTPDEEAATMLRDLKSRLRGRLGDNAFGYQAEWVDDAASTAHIDRLCEDMLASLTRVIDAEIARLSAYSHLDQERAAHGAFANEHTDGFIGRMRYLDAVARYVDSGDDHPLVLFAAGGLGKSALMARAATSAREAHANAVIVARFIGVTAASADPRSLLQDLCSEIGDAYGSTEPVPSTLQELQRELPARLQLASVERPLIVFLDSLDQLAGAQGTNLAWLPSDLPDGVHVITATRPGPILDALARRLPEDLVVELDKMPADEGKVLLASWLEKIDRTLRTGQRREILGRFRACGSPLYLRLAFEEARRWPSSLEEVRIGADEPSIIGDLYDRLEQEHGAEFVAHALGFLACTYERLGLSEDELLDTLTADEETWAEFTADAEWEMPIRRLPVVVWSRLYFDLAPYLSPRASEGASLLSFFHKELADVAYDRYVAGRAAHLHVVLSDVLRTLANGSDTGARTWQGSTHALAELPYHLTRAERWDDLFATLTDFTYLEQKAQRVAVVTGGAAGARDVSAYNGVRALIDDYDRALAAFPTESRPGGTSARADERAVLEAFARVLDRESHNLSQLPDLLWQQTYNRLQWIAPPTQAGVVSAALAPELEARSRPAARPWLHSITRLRESEALIRTLAGHAEDVEAVAWSPDGTRIVSGSEDHTVKVWDAATGAELATLTGHADRVWAVAWSPDGTRIVSGSEDHTIKVWDAATGVELATLTGHADRVRATAWSPDGTHIASGSDDGTVKVWDAATGVEFATLTGHEGRVMAVAYSLDGTRIVSGSADATLKIWDAATGTELATLTGHTFWVLAVAYSPDGTRIVSGSSTNMLSAAWENTLKVWDAATGAELASLTGHTSWVNAVAYSPDGTRFVSGSSDHTLKVWDATTGAELATVTGHTGDVEAVAYSPDGTRIVSGGTDNTLKVWDAASAAQLAAPTGHAARVAAIAYSPDGTRIASGSDDHTVKVWDATTGAELATLTGHEHGVCDVAYSRDGTLIVSRDVVNVGKVWDAASGAELAIPSDEIQLIGPAYSPDGTRHVSGSGTSEDTGVKVFDTATQAELASLAGHAEWVYTAAYSRDGTRIVSGSFDKTLKVWDADSGAELATLTGHTGAVDAVAYSPDGTRILSGSRELKLWDAEKLECMATLRCLGGLSCCDYSPQGTRICCGDTSGTVYILELMGAASVEGHEPGHPSRALRARRWWSRKR